jgi:hypothetical protein
MSRPLERRKLVLNLPQVALSLSPSMPGIATPRLITFQT